MRKIAILTVVLLSAAAMRAQELNFRIVPRPALIEQGKAHFIVRDALLVWLDPDAGLDRDYVSALLADAGIRAAFTDRESQAAVVLKLNRTAAFESEESYKLTVGSNRVTASARDGRGLHYALQTLRQMPVERGGKTMLPGCTITDTPAFGWRAFMLDESRHFHGMHLVKDLLDEMARLKMNVFHWHLVDDPGWRIEIRKYPLLTETGSKRDYSHRNLAPEEWDRHFPQRMYYTQDEIRDVVEYAAARGISVIPEIELPAHASASICAYQWTGSSSPAAGSPVWGDLYNVTDPRVEAFLKDILDEVIELFPSGIVHIGGDEADYTHWKNNPQINAFMREHGIPTYSDLQLWAINRMSNYLASKGRRMIGWNEITGDNVHGEEHFETSRAESLAPGTLVQFWDGNPELVAKAIAKGYDIVNSYRFYTYLDYSYETTPLEKAYSFDPVPEGIAGADRAKILGLGCQMWGEATPNALKVYYQMFPRIAAHAETGWTARENKDYEDFLWRFATVEAEWKKLGYIGPQMHKY